jgi:hypothetical protein
MNSKRLFFDGGEKCTHRRRKRNYPFGRKSSPMISCKDCGAVVTKFSLKKAKGRGGRR